MKEKELTVQAAAAATMLSGLGAMLSLALLAYIISPIDAIPDVIPVVGWADDGGAVMMLTAILYGLQKSGILETAMQVARVISSDVNETVDKAIDEVTK